MAGSSSSNSKTNANTNPLVTISVQTRKAKIATCAANALTSQAASRLSGYADGKIANFKKRSTLDKGRRLR